MGTKLFIGLALVTVLSASACGNPRNSKTGWMNGKDKADSTAATCWDAGDVVACDLRGCPKDCVITIEQSGRMVDVIDNCPKRDEYIELNPARLCRYHL